MPSSILNSDDGVISGTSGLKSSGGDDGVLVFQSKGTETARINTDSQIVAAAGTASLPALTTTGDVNTGIFFPAADTIAFAEGGAEAMRINSSGNVGIGTTSPPGYGAGFTVFQVNGSSSGIIQANNSTNSITTEIESENPRGAIGTRTNHPLVFKTNQTERGRFTSAGSFVVGDTSVGTGESFGWHEETAAKYCFIQNNTATAGSSPLYINRDGSDGTLIEFRHATTPEGSISVSGSTVSYNGGHLSRWAQMLTKPDLLKGTVMSNLDEMNVYIASTTYWTEEDELPVDEDGNPTVAVGDVKVETHEVQNEQLNKVKVSDVEGDANVAGVFVNWTYDEAHQVDEINMAMTGDMIIRIAQGVTVARGDLLMSAGDGTAKPQGDDIVRSKTIAKVTSTHVTCTYDDGSYCVPCVLMAC
jgi:hypothetical protein